MATIDIKKEVNSDRGQGSAKRVVFNIDSNSEVEYGVAADVILLSELEPGAVILSTYIDVLTVDAAAADVDLGLSAGDATAANLIDGADVTALGVTVGGVPLTAPVVVTGTANQNLKLTFNTNPLLDGVFRVTIVYVNNQNRSIEGGQIAPGSEQ